MKSIETKAMELALAARVVRDVYEQYNEVESLYPHFYDGEKIYGHYYQPDVLLENSAWNELRKELADKVEYEFGDRGRINRWFVFYGVRFTNYTTQECIDAEREMEDEEE